MLRSSQKLYRESVKAPAPVPAPARSRTAPGELEVLRSRLGNAGLASLLRAVQRKATVSTPGDPLELEADQVADQVMRSAAPGTTGASPPAIQRMCTECEEEGKGVQKKAEPSPSASEAEPDADVVLRAADSPGVPMSDSARGFFEPRFGQDFSQVRIHADARAAEMSVALKAQAFTYGRDIYFGEGKYRPSSPDGDRLLAHELTHVVQQGGGGALSGSAQRKAEDAGAGPVPVLGSASHTVQRNAEVYVWNPHVDGYGHAAIKLCDGTYISWWPAGPGTAKEQYWSGRPGAPHSYGDDIGPGGEGMAPDSTYDLGCNCLDEAAMKSWYDTNFISNPSPKWAVLKNSCSDVAHRALNAGSSVLNPCYASLSHTNAFWTPKDLGAYADCQSRWCGSKKAGALNATGRYVWENLKEVSGGWAINTLKSLWWKGEIVTH